MAMPRSASAGGSLRKAIRFNAPSGSPAASARAAAVIRESIGIPPHLSLPPIGPRHQSTGTHGNGHKERFNDEAYHRVTPRMAGGADRVARGREGADAAERR